MKIAFLASNVTLPGSSHRRKDAFEHDQTIDAFRGPFAETNLELCPISWDDPLARWTDYAAAIIGTTWDYWDRPDEFLRSLEHIESQTLLFNSADLIRWNSNKIYLRELKNRGAHLIPTVWLDQPTSSFVNTAFETLNTDDLILKRQVGAGAHGQHRLERGESIPAMPLPMLAQPFLPTILTEGEFSFIFIDGQLSHALRKRPTAGDYRIQSLYGGTEECHTPSAADQAAAEAVLTTLDTIPLYARVDMVRSDDGHLLLMELELIEPFLYPLQGPELGPRMAKAILKRITQSRHLKAP